ncbi:MAG: glycosyltransferase family 39 protein [Deltaproteobacteria bacterium]
MPVSDPGRLSRRAALALCLALGLGAALWAPRADTAHGLTARYFDSQSFSGAPSRTRLEREPFVPLGEPGPFSAEWTGYLFLPSPGVYRFHLDSDDDGELDLDGEPVVRDPGAHWAHGAEGRARLGAGLHRLRVGYVQRGGGAYLRVFYHFDSGPESGNLRPLPWSQLFPEGFAGTPAAFLSARGSYERARLLSGLAVLLLSLSLFLLYVEWRRFRGTGRLDAGALLTGAGLFLVGWIPRLIGGLEAHGRTWDERDYFVAGLQNVHNLLLGDSANQAFRFNSEHPPIAKWIYGVFTALLAQSDDDHLPGKLAASILGALTCLLVYLIVKELADRRTGLLAGALCALVPPFVAHGRVLGLEAPMAFFYTAAIYGFVRWLRQQDDWEPVFWSGLCTALAIFSRMTAVWVVPTLLVPYAAVLIARPERARTLRALLPYLAGIALGLAVVYFAWVWIWRHPLDQLRVTYSHWGYRVEEWYLGRFQAPPGAYYVVAFLLSAPALYLAATALWTALALRRRTIEDLLLAGWLAFPFLQSISTFRQDQVRYVIQAFPALAATSAVGFFGLLWPLLERRFAAARRPAVAYAAAAGFALYAAALCAWVHPYYLDFYGELAGGPGGVQARRLLELSWWGEGVIPLVDWVNANAPKGARIAESLTPNFDAPRLRDDLRQSWPGEADYLVENDFGFANLAGPGPGWRLVHVERAGNADIGWVYERLGSGPGSRVAR